MNKNLSGLYAITDASLMGDNLITMAEQAMLAGITVLQYRNKTATMEQQQKEALTLAALCKKHQVLFIINDNVELAIKVAADGVHLGQGDANIKHAREQLGTKKIIGITCNNNIELAKTAQQQGADYVAFGRFYSSQTKPTAPSAELSILSVAKKHITIPIVAIGGITPTTAPTLLNQGADMLAVIHGLFGQKDVTAATQQLVNYFSSSKTS